MEGKWEVQFSLFFGDAPRRNVKKSVGCLSLTLKGDFCTRIINVKAIRIQMSPKAPGIVGMTQEA